MNMDQKKIIILVHLLAVGQASTKIETRVYNKDFSVALRGDLVTESSWKSSRVPPTLEKSLVGCASACVDKYREDLSCNSIMFVGETKECHMGNTTLADADEATEFVYRIPDGTGKGWLQLDQPEHFSGTVYREYGKLYFGANFNETFFVPSVEECAQKCKDSGRCKFWCWAINGNNNCLLKQGVTFKRDVPGWISGNKP